MPYHGQRQAVPVLEAQEKALEIITGAKELILDCKTIFKETNLLKPEDIAKIINTKYPEFQEA